MNQHDLHLVSHLSGAQVQGAAPGNAAMGIVRSLIPLLPSTCLVFFGCSSPQALLQDPRIGAHEFRITELVDGLDRPWGVAFLPDGDLLITERAGSIRWVRDGELVPEPVQGGPSVSAGGQGGLLDIALHPDFPENGFVYLTYSKAVEGGLTTAVARAHWTGEALEGIEDILVARAVATGGRHFGSRLRFDRDGYLWVTIGERGQEDPAQSLDSHMGKTLRLLDDGSPAPDNPFAGDSSALPEIFSYGHRNVQGLDLHPATGELWLHEHGPRGGDEVQRILPGRNYGWPEVSFGRQYSMLPIPDPEPGQGFELPLHHWTPSIAPSGMAFYTGDLFPHWREDLFVGALAGRHLRRVVFVGVDPVHEEVLLSDYGERIRDVRSGPDGFLYFLTDSADGVLGRLEPASR